MTTTNIENVTLSLPNTDLAMLRLLSRRMGWKLIYLYEQDTCSILMVWDCKRNPEDLQNNSRFES